MADYRTQFNQLQKTIDDYNLELAALRVGLADSQRSYYDLRTQNELLGEEVDTLKARRELHIGLNEERRLK